MFVKGNRISLRALEKSDLPYALYCRNHPDVREAVWFREFRPLNMVNQEKWFASLAEGHDIMFVVIATEGGERVGVAGLTHINWHNRSAELSWYVGEEVFRKLQLDKEIVSMLLAYGFRDLGMHRIFAECYVPVVDRITTLTDMGFKHEGALRDVVFRQGKWWDSVVLSMLEAEYADQRAKNQSPRPCLHYSGSVG